MATEVSTPTPAAKRTPTPTATPLRAPESAPSEAYAPGQESLAKKPAGETWKSFFDFGVGVPLSDRFPSAYNLGFNVEIGEGCQFTELFSGWVDVDIDSFGSKNDSLTGGNSYTLISLALWARYRLVPGAISPYFFAGPGVSYNESRSSTSNGYNYYTGGINFPISSSEIDFLVEGGGGIELKAAPEMTLFLQGKLSYDFISQNFAGATGSDSPLVLLPLEVGVIFGI